MEKDLLRSTTLGNTGKYRHKHFLDRIPIAWEIRGRIDKWYYIISQSFCT
jgi:hypothetical protein